MQRPGTVGCRQRAEMTYSPVAMVMTRRGWRSWVPASDYTSPIGPIFLVLVLAWSY